MIRVICAWCGREMKDSQPFGPVISREDQRKCKEAISHGICLPCLKVMKKEDKL